MFESEATGCANCHRPPLFTDGQRHDVGTGGHPDEQKGPDFDTPSLRGVHATPPYLHDGRAATLREQLDDLVAFLVSLPFDIDLFRGGFE